MKRRLFLIAAGNDTNYLQIQQTWNEMSLQLTEASKLNMRTQLMKVLRNYNPWLLLLFDGSQYLKILNKF